MGSQDTGVAKSLFSVSLTSRRALLLHGEMINMNRRWDEETLYSFALGKCLCFIIDY